MVKKSILAAFFFKKKLRAVGFEPTTFGLRSRRVNHYATLTTIAIYFIVHFDVFRLVDSSIHQLIYQPKNNKMYNEVNCNFNEVGRSIDRPIERTNLGW